MIDRDVFSQMWLSGVSVPEMSARLGCQQPQIYKLRLRFGLPNRPRVNCTDKDPTPQEIAERAKECREAHYAKMKADVSESIRLRKELQERRLREIRLATNRKHRPA